jgi:RecA/RadA recombinase
MPFRKKGCGMTKLTDFITPAYINDPRDNFDFKQLKIEDVRQPLQGELLAKFEKLRERNKKVDDLWTLSVDHKEGDRSARDFTLVKELKGEGFTLKEIAVILWNYLHGKVSSVKNPVREIIRCYERSGNDFSAGLDQADLDRIEEQINPLKAEQEKVQRLIDSASFITSGEATFVGSGIPLYKYFMNAETVNVLFGPAGSGKSFVTLDFAMHLAAGKDWCGFKCKKKMAVLYICTESGASFGKRTVAARDRVGVKAGTSITEHPFAYYPAHVDLLNNRDHLKLIASLIDKLESKSGYKCGLVIIDTLSAAFGGGNENSEDMAKFVNNMSEIKFKKKTAVLVVHHTGKDESAGARGHSSLKGNIDTEIQVKAEKRGERWLRSFSSTKQKDDEIGNQKRFGLEIVELGKDEDGDAITTCNIVLDGDFKFDAIAPSILDNLTQSQILAIKAAYIYHKLAPSPDRLIQRGKDFTPKEVKALILNDLRQKDKKDRILMSDVGVCLEHLGVCAKPVPRAMTKYLEDQRKTMEQNGVKAFDANFQLFDEYLEHMERTEKME